MKRTRSSTPVLLVGMLAGALVAWMILRKPATETPPTTTSSERTPAFVKPAQPIVEAEPTEDPEPEAPTPRPPKLSALAPPPDWKKLNRWQACITREEFVEMMEEVFTVSSAWEDWFLVGENDVFIETGVRDERFRLRFAKPGVLLRNPRLWRSADQLGPAPTNQPLDGLHIAIDAGHLGGRWSKIEERWFQIGDAKPVTEGDMTLLVAYLLRPRLESLGATVSLVRETTEPVTSDRPESLMEDAGDSSTDSPSKLAERLFYRTSEIRARAELVNETIQPDLVLCLHFNAEGWGDPLEPTLTDRHHFHLLVNGAYTDGEVALADQRYQMTRKIVERTHLEEAAIARSVADAFATHTKLPPYLYEPNSRRAVNVQGNPYIWARNLLANRLYHCPVVFLEPYVMNSKQDYARIQLGDYDGMREVNGKLRPSIFREYADALTDGLENYYKDARE